MGRFTSQVLCCRACGTRERSDVHFISSTSPFRSEAGHGPYATAKACVETLAMTMAKDERQHGVRVNVIAPGLVETEMGKRLVKATQGVDDIKEIYPKYPFGRVCQPEDIAKLSAFLGVGGRGLYLGARDSSGRRNVPLKARLRGDRLWN